MLRATARDSSSSLSELTTTTRRPSELKRRRNLITQPASLLFLSLFLVLVLTFMIIDNDYLLEIYNKSTNGVATSRRRILSISLGNGNCEWMEATPLMLPRTTNADKGIKSNSMIRGTDHNIDGTLFASYPSADMDMTWKHHTEGLTGIRMIRRREDDELIVSSNNVVDDSVTNTNNANINIGLVPTHYPHHEEGKWSYDESNINRVILLIRNPRWALPSYFMKMKLHEISTTTTTTSTPEMRITPIEVAPPMKKSTVADENTEQRTKSIKWNNNQNPLLSTNNNENNGRRTKSTSWNGGENPVLSGFNKNNARALSSSSNYYNNGMNNGHVHHQDFVNRTFVDQLWIKWRDHRFEEELNLWSNFIDFYMYNGAMYWYNVDFERNGQAPFLYRDETDKPFPQDIHCVSMKNDLCVPSAIISFEHLEDLEKGPKELRKIAKVLRIQQREHGNNRDRIRVADDDAINCIYHETLINNHPGGRSVGQVSSSSFHNVENTNTTNEEDDANYYDENDQSNILHHNFTVTQLKAMIFKLELMIDKYSMGIWENHGLAKDLVSNLEEYVFDILNEIEELNHQSNNKNNDESSLDSKYLSELEEWYKSIGKGDRYSKERMQKTHLWQKVSHLYESDDDEEKLDNTHQEKEKVEETGEKVDVTKEEKKEDVEEKVDVVVKEKKLEGNVGGDINNNNLKIDMGEIVKVD